AWECSMPPAMIVGIILSVVGPVAAQTSYPMITHTSPVAVQRGKTTEVTVEGQMNFHGTYKALLEGGGVTAEVVAAPPPKGAPPPAVRSVKLKVTVPTAPPL